VVVTCSVDGTIRFFDLRSPAAFASTSNEFASLLSTAMLTAPTSPTEKHALDWNKYRQFVLVSAGLNKAMKIWDCHMLQHGGLASVVGSPCENRLFGHEYTIRKGWRSPLAARELGYVQVFFSRL
jgi:peroxin-7